jgi:hypothetical protein
MINATSKCPKGSTASLFEPPCPLVLVDLSSTFHLVSEFSLFLYMLQPLLLTPRFLVREEHGMVSSSTGRQRECSCSLICLPVRSINFHLSFIGFVMPSRPHHHADHHVSLRNLIVPRSRFTMSNIYLLCVSSQTKLTMLSICLTKTIR